MAYVPDALAMVINPVGGFMPRYFEYYDAAAESDATLVGAGFISDGVPKGLRKGDIVDVIQVATPKYKRYQVLSASGAAVTLQAPTAIT